MSDSRHASRRGARVVRVVGIGIAAATVLVLVAACGSVTSGHGAGGDSGSAASSPDFPSQPAAPISTAPPTPVSTPAAPTTPSAPPAAQTIAQRRAQLQIQNDDRAAVLVAVPGGYEAADYDQTGEMGFWREATTAAIWTLIGESSYPIVPDVGPPQATTIGRLLLGMRDATFIVHGNFTGDGSGNAVAYTTGAKGWGTIKAERNGNIGSSGESVGADEVGLAYDFAFVRGHLVTKDCPTNRPISDCGSHPVTKTWTWTGHDFKHA
jgi:hypothetical protein